jgi:hypothetical protein
MASTNPLATSPFSLAVVILVLTLAIKVYALARVVPTRPVICSHRGLLHGDASTRAPIDRREWERALAALHAAGVGCVDVDVTPGGAAVEDVGRVGHPKDVGRDSTAEGSARLGYEELLDLVEGNPWLHASVELKPEAEGGSGAQEVRRRRAAHMLTVAERRPAHVRERLFFQFDDELQAGNGGAHIGVPLRGGDADCGLGARGGGLKPSVAVLMPSLDCLSSTAVQAGVGAWRRARGRAGLSTGEVHVWIVDSCADLGRVTSAPLQVDRVVSNVPDVLLACSR